MAWTPEKDDWLWYSEVFNDWAHGSITGGYGICHHFCSGVAAHWVNADDWLAEQFKVWPEFSGDPEYPVPRCGFNSPCAAYWNGDPATGNSAVMVKRWDASTEYGAARLRLCKFLSERALLEACDAEIDLLKQIRDVLLMYIEHPESIPMRNIGICTNLKESIPNGEGYSNAVKWWLHGCFRMWPEYTGNLVHPVPSMDKDKTPEQAYSELEDCWDDSTEYGQARIRLAVFIAACADKEIQDAAAKR